MTKPYREWTGRPTPNGRGVMIDCEEDGGGATWPGIGEGLNDLEWELRYGDPASVRSSAASVVSAYRALIKQNRETRAAIVRCIRQACEGNRS